MALLISADLAPTGGGSWPTHSDTYGKGGYRAVADNTARDAIPSLRRSAGMLVYNLATGATYRLGAGLGNGDWALQSSGVITAGNGLTGTTTLSVQANGGTLDVSASGVKVATGGISGNELAAGAVDLASAKVTGLLPLANIANGSACSLLGRSANSVGGQASIAAGTNGFVFLRRADVVTGALLLNENVDPAAGIAGTKISPNFGAQNIVTTGFISIGANPASAGAVRLASQATISALSTLAANHTLLTLDSGDNVVLGSSAGPTVVSGGSTIRLLVSGNEVLQAQAATIFVATTNLSFGVSVVNPVLAQATSATNSDTGDKLTIRAQTCSGTTSTGGALDIGPGAGTSANGLGRLIDGSAAQKLGWNDTGIGFYATAPVAKQTVTGSRGGNAALASLLTALATTGLLTDSSSA